MAVTQNNYTGNGSTVLYSFTFPYLDPSDIKIEVNGTLTTAYTLANATTIQFNTAPANGATIRIYRDTAIEQLSATFFPGSAIRADDLNDDFTQTLYKSQELESLVEPLASLQGTYYGAYASNPTVDPFGNPLTPGDLYFNTTLDQMYVFNGSTWQQASADATITRFKFTAAGGETSLSGNDDNAQSLTYNVGLEMVYLNGALLTRGVDYVATNGSSITGLVALTAADLVEVVVFSQIDAIGSAIPSASITFLQTGTGAVQRTVDSKLKDILDRDDFVDDSSFNTASAGKVAINGTNTVLAPRFEGNTTTDSGTPDAVFRVSRTHTGSASPHGFREQTTFNPSSAGVAAACFDAALTSTGSQNQDHTIGFQVRNAHGGTGTLSNLQSFGSYLVANGPVTNSHGLEINTVTGTGTVTNEYGVYIKNLTKGTNKYPIFIANNVGTNSIGAATNFNNSGVVSVGGLVKLFLGDSGNGYKSIAYNHNMNSNTYDYGDQIQSIYFGPQDITFRCAPVGTAGATPTFTNILSIRTDSGNPSYLAVFPTTDNVSNLGLGGFRWKEIFCANGTINTSDARVKTEVRQLSNPEVAAAKDLAREIGAYKFLAAVAEKGDSARDHVGMTVQRCIEIMEQHGLNPMAYGFICYDQWEDEYEDVSAVPSWVEDPETGELVQGPDKEPAHRKLTREAGDLYSFRTEQLLLFIARGFEARLSALEATS